MFAKIDNLTYLNFCLIKWRHSGPLSNVSRQLGGSYFWFWMCNDGAESSEQRQIPQSRRNCQTGKTRVKRYAVIECLLTQMTTSNFLHPKNIKSMIVVLVIVLGKVLSQEEINTQHQQWSNKIRNLPFTCPNKLHSWKTGIKNIFGQRWINNNETIIIPQY